MVFRELVKRLCNQKKQTMKNTLSALLLCGAICSQSQIKVFSGGSVSYGSTTGPSYGEKHHFSGNTIISATPTFPGSGGSAAFIRGNDYFSSATTPDYTWQGNDQTGFFHPASNQIGITLGGSEKIKIISNGDLLIGTSNDNAKINTYCDYTAGYFKVDHASDWYPTLVTETNRHSSVNYQLKLGSTTTFYVAGDGWIYSGGNYLGSDQTLKNTIATIDSASAKINKIRGVTYKLNKETQNPLQFPNAKSYMGVVAQEIELVAPEVVKNMHDGTKAVCYEMLVGLLIQASKEQNSKIAKLETDLNTCCSSKSGNKSNRLNNLAPGTIFDEDGESYLKQNKPNPFNKETVIDYNVIENGTAKILVFDMSGKLLKTIPVKIPGKGSITINASDFKAGMYYYSLIVNDAEIDTKKMILTE
jgi:hypothetical protein